ncbi:hypothetical protein C7I87_06450 [Mesorhizobium sp. SARCC-RB16n]|uniref:hypothetical protein n=1 Tax=Mesorhizobium sp. SARCC-RB16n TaxID=2116687 RepID=UPI00122EC8D8|nr:hypothetical protein [Mesorhizobium sp. SARCC-RB16n]KAA3451642.1 hypothetical protein C7I87_06450 [Mesorhizobium sp. SARCC-RB16n]
MANSKRTPIDGFYTAYFSGMAGNSIGMFVFKEGVVVGADAGGGRYDGEYALTDDGKYIEAKIHFTLTMGSQSITGLSADVEPLGVDVPLRLPVEFNRTDVHRIETPLGPINAKFDKIRSA